MSWEHVKDRKALLAGNRRGGRNRMSALTEEERTALGRRGARTLVREKRTPFHRFSRCDECDFVGNAGNMARHRKIYHEGAST